MNRSSCAGGSGYVPSWPAVGFWVAITMKGGAIGRVVPVDGDVTFLHRFEQAGLRLGVARLSSSTSSTWVNTGTRPEVNQALSGRQI